MSAAVAVEHKTIRKTPLPRMILQFLLHALVAQADGVVAYPTGWGWNQSEGMICDWTLLLHAFGFQGRPFCPFGIFAMTLSTVVDKNSAAGSDCVRLVMIWTAFVVLALGNFLQPAAIGCATEHDRGRNQNHQHREC